ncbi:MAG: Ig-like domain-containing protein, partial [Thermoplasmata archaeon]|nr:Ig-like domain-containing protein [Thermoplasmata archaeon]
FDNLQVWVLDYYNEPIDGARVTVSESQLILFDVLTDISGSTQVMVVKDRTVSDSGVIFSPLKIEAQANGYNFDIKTGIHAHASPILTFTDLGDIVLPGILNISISDGNRVFPVNDNITFSFSEAMNQTAVENAFSISGNVTGAFTWNGFNLTFTPDNLDYNTYYTIVISTEATDSWGNNLENPISLSFTTAGAPASGNNTLLIGIIVIFAIAGIVGWFVLKRLSDNG